MFAVLTLVVLFLSVGDIIVFAVLTFLLFGGLVVVVVVDVVVVVFGLSVSFNFLFLF